MTQRGGVRFDEENDPENNDSGRSHVSAGFAVRVFGNVSPAAETQRSSSSKLQVPWVQYGPNEDYVFRLGGCGY